MYLRADNFGVRLRPLLAKSERADIVAVTAGNPAVAQFRPPHHVEAHTAERRRIRVIARHAAILYPVHNDVEVRPRLGLAAKIQVMSECISRIVLEMVSQIVTSIDRPVISESYHETALRTR